ncbi:hypothetical protein HN419_07210 [Candidatus Woesearchaeota archaeon]|jgi:hypothetical protein|nr:hypothetical protein [Candidatus Woesearchaeota archaeon]
MADDPHKQYRSAELRYKNKKHVAKAVYPEDENPRGADHFNVDFPVPPDAREEEVTITAMTRVNRAQIKGEKKVHIVAEPPVKVECKFENEDDKEYTTNKLKVPSGRKVKVRVTLPNNSKFTKKREKDFKLALVASFRGQSKVPADKTRPEDPKIKIFDYLKGSLNFTKEDSVVDATFEIDYDEYIKQLSRKKSLVSSIPLNRAGVLDVFIDAEVLGSRFVYYSTERLKVLEGKGKAAGKIVGYGFDDEDMQTDNVKVFARDKKGQEYGESSLSNYQAAAPNTPPTWDFLVEDLPKDRPLEIVARIKDRDVYVFEGNHREPFNGNDGNGGKDWIEGSRKKLWFIPYPWITLDVTGMVVPVYAGSVDVDIEIQSSDDSVKAWDVSDRVTEMYVTLDGHDKRLGKASHSGAGINNKRTWKIRKLPVTLVGDDPKKLTVCAKHKDYFGEDDDGNATEEDARHTSKNGSGGDINGTLDGPNKIVLKAEPTGAEDREQVKVPVVGGKVEVAVCGYDGRKLMADYNAQKPTNVDSKKLHNYVKDLKNKGLFREALQKLIKEHGAEVYPFEGFEGTVNVEVSGFVPKDVASPYGKDVHFHESYEHPRFMDGHFVMEGIPLPFKDGAVKVVHTSNKGVHRLGEDMSLGEFDQQNVKILDKTLDIFKRDIASVSRKIVVYIDLYGSTSKALVIGATFTKLNPTERDFMAYDCLGDVQVELYENNELHWKTKSVFEKSKAWVIPNVFANYKLFGFYETQYEIQVPRFHVNRGGTIYEFKETVMYDEAGRMVGNVPHAVSGRDPDSYVVTLDTKELIREDRPVFGPNFEYEVVGKGSIAGTVYEELHQEGELRPLPESTVWLEDEDGHEIRGFKKSDGHKADKEGKYKLEKVPAGRFIVKGSYGCGEGSSRHDPNAPDPLVVEISGTDLDHDNIDVYVRFPLKINILKPQKIKPPADPTELSNAVKNGEYVDEQTRNQWKWKGTINGEERTLQNVKDNIYPLAERVDWFLLDEGGVYVKDKNGKPISLKADQNDPCKIFIPARIGGSLKPGTTYKARFAITTRHNGRLIMAKVADVPFTIQEVPELLGIVEGVVFDTTNFDLVKDDLVNVRAYAENNAVADSVTKDGVFRLEDLPLNVDIEIWAFRANDPGKVGKHTDPHGSDGRNGGSDPVLDDAGNVVEHKGKRIAFIRLVREDCVRLIEGNVKLGLKDVRDEAGNLIGVTANYDGRRQALIDKLKVDDIQARKKAFQAVRMATVVVPLDATDALRLYGKVFYIDEEGVQSPLGSEEGKTIKLRIEVLEEGGKYRTIAETEPLMNFEVVGDENYEFNLRGHYWNLIDQHAQVVIEYDTGVSDRFRLTHGTPDKASVMFKEETKELAIDFEFEAIKGHIFGTVGIKGGDGKLTPIPGLKLDLCRGDTVVRTTETTDGSMPVPEHLIDENGWKDYMNYVFNEVWPGKYSIKLNVDESSSLVEIDGKIYYEDAQKNLHLLIMPQEGEHKDIDLKPQSMHPLNFEFERQRMVTVWGKVSITDEGHIKPLAHNGVKVKLMKHVGGVPPVGRWREGASQQPNATWSKTPDGTEYNYLIKILAFDPLRVKVDYERRLFHAMGATSFTLKETDGTSQGEYHDLSFYKNFHFVRKSEAPVPKKTGHLIGVVGSSSYEHGKDNAAVQIPIADVTLIATNKASGDVTTLKSFAPFDSDNNQPFNVTIELEAGDYSIAVQDKSVKYGGKGFLLHPDHVVNIAVKENVITRMPPFTYRLSSSFIQDKAPPIKNILPPGPTKPKELPRIPDRPKLTAGEHNLTILTINGKAIPEDKDLREKHTFLLLKGKDGLTLEGAMTSFPPDSKVLWELKAPKNLPLKTRMLSAHIGSGDFVSSFEGQLPPYSFEHTFFTPEELAKLEPGNYSIELSDQSKQGADKLNFHIVIIDKLDKIDLGEVNSLEQALALLQKPEEDINVAMALIKACYQLSPVKHADHVSGAWSYDWGLLYNNVKRYPLSLVQVRYQALMWGSEGQPALRSRLRAIKIEVDQAADVLYPERVQEFDKAYDKFTKLLKEINIEFKSNLEAGWIVKHLQLIFERYARELKNPKSGMAGKIGKDPAYITNYFIHYDIVGLVAGVSEPVHGKWVQKLKEDWFTSAYALPLWKLGEKFFHEEFDKDTGLLQHGYMRGPRRVLRELISKMLEVEKLYNHMVEMESSGLFEEDKRHVPSGWDASVEKAEREEAYLKRQRSNDIEKSKRHNRFSQQREQLKIQFDQLTKNYGLARRNKAKMDNKAIDKKLAELKVLIPKVAKPSQFVYCKLLIFDLICLIPGYFKGQVPVGAGAAKRVKLPKEGETAQENKEVWDQINWEWEEYQRITREIADTIAKEQEKVKHMHDDKKGHDDGFAEFEALAKAEAKLDDLVDYIRDVELNPESIKSVRDIERDDRRQKIDNKSSHRKMDLNRQAALLRIQIDQLQKNLDIAVRRKATGWRLPGKGECSSSDVHSHLNELKAKVDNVQRNKDFVECKMMIFDLIGAIPGYFKGQTVVGSGTNSGKPMAAPERDDELAEWEASQAQLWHENQLKAFQIAEAYRKERQKLREHLASFPQGEELNRRVQEDQWASGLIEHINAAEDSLNTERDFEREARSKKRGRDSSAKADRLRHYKDRLLVFADQLIKANKSNKGGVKKSVRRLINEAKGNIEHAVTATKLKEIHLALYDLIGKIPKLDGMVGAGDSRYRRVITEATGEDLGDNVSQIDRLIEEMERTKGGGSPPPPPPQTRAAVGR